MSTTAFPPGIYRIDVAGGVEAECLTREKGNGVTILPPSSQPDPEQQVICCFMTSSIVCRSLTMLVASRPWERRKHHHRAPLPVHPWLLPYLQRRSRETRGR